MNCRRSLVAVRLACSIGGVAEAHEEDVGYGTYDAL
jgi:hypothetical protein